MKAAHKKELYLFDEVYRVGLNIVICSNTDEWGNFLDSIGFTGERLDHVSQDAVYYRVNNENNKNGNNTNVIFLRTKNFSALLHELIHLTFNAFDEKGIPTRVENDEAFAYYVESWFTRVRKAWSGSSKL